MASPRIWLLQGEKAGDNAQMEQVAEALGWPVERRHLAMQEAWRFGKPRVRPSLAHVDLAHSDTLAPPWPDGVLTVGRRMSAAALWIRRKSRGHTKLVLLGKPRQRQRSFDLVVASAQYRLRHAPNVLRTRLPLMRLDPLQVERAGVAWQTRLGHLARPLTALLVGGPTRAARLDAAVAQQLVRACTALPRPVGAQGGSLYATTSRRTPPGVIAALETALPASACLHRWAPETTDNPYLGLLALADRFVVTSDSITMMVEVARLARPLAIFELPQPASSGLRRFTRGRDLTAVPRQLMASGHAVPLGAPFPSPTAPPEDELPKVAERIRALWPPHGDVRV